MLGKLGLPELLIIFAVALLIFGPRRLGELGKGLGDGIRSFKSAVKDNKGEPIEDKDQSVSATQNDELSRLHLVTNRDDCPNPSPTFMVKPADNPAFVTAY